MPMRETILTLALLGWATAAAAQDAPSTPPARTTTMIGRHDHELILSKIAVTDLVRSYEFYTKAIGLKLASPQLQPPRATDPEKDFVEYPLNFTGSLADPFFVIYKRKGQVVTPEGAANSVLGFKVPSAQAAVERAMAAGARAAARPPPGGETALGPGSDPEACLTESVRAPNNP